MRFTHLAFPAFALATLAGCSDPVPPTPQGAWSVSLTHDDADCQISSHNADLGGISVDTRSNVVIDGQEGAAVSCSVTGAGPFAVHASAGKEGDNLEILIDKIDKNATPDATVPGSTAYSSAAHTAAEPYQSPAGGCNFYFTPDTKEGVESGKIWVAFNCPEVVAGMSKCDLKQGYAIFENCTTDAAEE